MHVFINDVQSFAIRLCFIPIIILAQMACVHGNESNHYGQKIDKVYGRPNIDQHYPHSIDNGMRRRSGEMSGAHHYNNNNRVAFKNKILQYANRRGEFHYNDKKGCKANIYFVHWPIIGENQYESDNENKEQHADTKNHYEARPADEYGFKKLVVELHDVYDEKAHQPPKLDLSDLIYPANDYVQESIQGYQYNGYEAPIEPPYNTQHDDYQHTADEIDKFGVLPYQEVQPYSATNTAAIEPLPPSPPEIYPDGHDKFSYLPYKESDGQQNKYNEYNTVPPAPVPDVTVTAIPELAAISTLQTIITAAQTLPISLASTPEFTTQTSGTLTPSIKDSLTLISSTTNILTALANAQAEAEKLPEPGPPVACSGEKISVGECSALFTCKATGQLFTCWDEQVPENFNLVYDSVSQSCRNFNALRECSRDAFCANEATTRDSTGRPFFPLGGNCTRIAHDCFGMMETITCEIDGQVIDPTASGDCVLAREVPGCEPLITRQ